MNGWMDGRTVGRMDNQNVLDIKNEKLDANYLAKKVP